MNHRDEKEEDQNPGFRYNKTATLHIKRPDWR
jgi:hypothetical protein